MPDPSTSLLATIRTALDASPPAVAQPGTLRLHTLFSIPRQVKSLYPLAHIHPTDLEYNKNAASIGALEEQIFITASWSPLTQANAPPPDSDARDETEHTDNSPLLILAMELYLYTIPEFGSAVLYVSKLDSSGYAPQSIPTPLRQAVSTHVFTHKPKLFGNTLTATLSSAITQHFTSFRHWDSTAQASAAVNVSHLSVHILARSQRAYLFPSSPENPNKKVLSDAALIKWWRAVMSDVVVATRDETSPIRAADSKRQLINARAYYVIPGYTKLESHPLVPLARQDSSDSTTQPPSSDQVLRQANWTYGHPYSSNGAHCSESDLPPLPLHWHASSFCLRESDNHVTTVQTDPSKDDYNPKRVRTVPTLMPHFCDDPKTRFLDEMARDAHEHSGWKVKTTSTASTASTASTTASNGAVDDNVAAAQQNGSKDQIDDLQLIRQEQHSPQDRTNKRAAKDSDWQDKADKRTKTQGAAASCVSTTTASGVPLITLRALMRERQAMDDLPIDEFWERMGFRQECCSGNAVGVLVILFTRQPTRGASSSSHSSFSLERQPLSLPYKVLGDLVFRSLMKDSCEWNKLACARQLTENWFQAVNREVKRKGGLTQFMQDAGNQDEHAVLVGKGTIWDDFVLHAPTQHQIDSVKQHMQHKPNSSAAASPVASTNMLSVKRKKKPVS